MSKILKIINFNNSISNDLNLEIKEDSFNIMLGASGMGKSALVKSIAGIYRYSGEIVIDGFVLNDKNKKSIYRNIGILFENPDNIFYSETVMDEISFALINIGTPKKETKEIVLKLAHDLGIESILERNPRELSGSEKQIVALAAALVKKPKLLIIDDAFNRLNESATSEVLNYLEKQKLTVLYLTSSTELAPYFENIILLHNGNIVKEGSFELLKDEKLLNSINLNQPFMVSLSNKLSYYELVEDVILDMGKMVDKIWK